jgi:sodium/pantothenate symporter
MDGLVSAYVVSEFPVFIGLIVVMGLLSAGLSTLEGLIQSLSSTITGDILKPIAVRFAWLERFESGQIVINRVVIVLLALLSLWLSWDQIVDPKLSVGIFAQNGVYAYFSAAFIPILFGMFYPKADLRSVFAASVVAVVVHFSMYYGQIAVPFSRATGENPGVAAAVAIILSVITAFLLSIGRSRDAREADR